LIHKKLTFAKITEPNQVFITTLVSRDHKVKLARWVPHMLLTRHRAARHSLWRMYTSIDENDAGYSDLPRQRPSGSPNLFLPRGDFLLDIYLCLENHL